MKHKHKDIDHVFTIKNLPNGIEIDGMMVTYDQIAHIKSQYEHGSDSKSYTIGDFEEIVLLEVLNKLKND